MKQVKSKRLIMSPMAIEDINDLIAKETNEDRIKEYNSIIEKATNNPDEDKWNSIWKISLKEDGKMIGEAHFSGLDSAYSKLSYNVFKEYWGNDYTFEVVEAMVNYATSQDEIFFIEVTVKNDDHHAIEALNKLKFKLVSEKNGMMVYSMEKPKSRFLIIFISIGLCVGVAIGISLSQIAIGAVVGMCLGAVIGGSIDKNDEDKRKESQEKRNSVKK